MSEKMREEFEVWCESIGYHTTRDCDTYSGGYPRAMWMAWQASRASLAVELPSDINGEYYADGWNAALMCVEGRLKEAGISYK